MTGTDSNGALGLGENQFSRKFTKINISNIVAVSLGFYHSKFLNGS